MKINRAALFSVAAIAGILAFAACSKKNSDTKTKTNYLTVSPWKFSQAGVDFDSSGSIDLQIPAIYLQGCDVDNIYTLRADNSGTADEGPSKCDASAPQSTTFSWNLINNEKEINFSTQIFAGVGGSAKIIELSDTRFLISKRLAVPGYPLPQPVIVVMVH